MSKISIAAFGLILFNISLFGQINPEPFNIALEPVSITGLGGLQSYAVGQHNGKWLIVGGRLDGLHRRQPFASFDAAGHNNQLIVVDPVSLQKWQAPLTSLPAGIQEHLSSTNMEFYQEGDYVYCLGGYGYSSTARDHVTYDKLTAIKVSAVIDAIIGSNSFTAYFRQISDSKFQVTGGRLKKIYDTYYLLGGQKFMGRYNPMGPSHGPGFTQEYTNAIRKFKIDDNGTAITIRHLPSFIDTASLHRRDYNAEAQILQNGQEGITMFSGVFQLKVDLPFLNSVTVDSSKYTVNHSFQQYYNHYHCPVLPLYSAIDNEMHNVFFGGIAQYYDSAGTLIQNDSVPFVKTIARVSRDTNGVLTEYKLPIEMPNLLGSGAEFIVNKKVEHYTNEVLKLDQITADSTLVGYIFGGISSTAKNIFWVNDGTQSKASNTIYKVFLTKNDPLSVYEINQRSRGNMSLEVYPNPSNGALTVKFKLLQIGKTKIIIHDLKGQLVKEVLLQNLNIGMNAHSLKIDNLDQTGVYMISIETPDGTARQKVIIEP